MKYELFKFFRFIFVDSYGLITDINIHSFLPAFFISKQTTDLGNFNFSMLKKINFFESFKCSNYYQFFFGMLKNILCQSSHKTIFLADRQHSELKSFHLAIALLKADIPKCSEVFVIETGRKIIVVQDYSVVFLHIHFTMSCTCLCNNTQLRCTTIATRKYLQIVSRTVVNETRHSAQNIFAFLIPF